MGEGFSLALMDTGELGVVGAPCGFRGFVAGCVVYAYCDYKIHVSTRYISY